MPVSRVQCPRTFSTDVDHCMCTIGQITCSGWSARCLCHRVFLHQPNAIARIAGGCYDHSCHSLTSTWPRMSMAVIAGNLAFFPLSGRAINLRFEHPVFHPMICYFKGLFACATSRATINVPPDQCYERVLAQAFWVLHCLSQVTEYMRTTATLPLVTASLILGQY